MYTPKHFQNTNTTELIAFIKAHGFGILISQSEGNILASHIPIEISDDGSKLAGHIARGNQQWKNFSDDHEVLAIFQGAHSYISSSWYNHENVPTWNYIAIHVYGRIQIIEGEKLHLSLKNLVDKYEKNVANPVSVEKLSAEYIKKAMVGIVGFEITISKIEASYKLSQNRDQESFKNIIQELEKRNDDSSLQVAAAMKENGCPAI